MPLPPWMLAALVAAPLLPYGDGPVLQAEVHPPVGQHIGNFGLSVALDGDWLAVLETTMLFPTGVIVYRRNEGVWQPKAKLLHTAFEAHPLAIDYPYLAIADPGFLFFPSGRVRLFAHNGISWVWETDLTQYSFSHDLGNGFGASVSFDGEHLAVGATYTVGIGDKGLVTVFVRQPAGWEIEQVIHPPTGSGNYFGDGVDLSGDWLLVRNFHPSFQLPGIHLFHRTEQGWQHVQSFQSDRTAIALDDDYLLAGTSVHRRVGSSWVPDGELPKGTGSGDEFGFLDAGIEGQTIAVGDASANGGVGTVFLYQRLHGTWVETGKTAGPWIAGDGYGTQTALSGNRVVSGAPFRDNPHLAGGTAFVHVISAAPATYCTAKLDSQGCLPAIEFSGSSSASDPAPFEIRATRVMNQALGVLAYGFGPADVPFLGGTLCLASPVRRTPPQTSGGTPPPASDCSGAFTLDMNAQVQLGVDPLLVPGVEVSAQYWYRDAFDPTGAGLSDALSFVLCP